MIIYIYIYIYIAGSSRWMANTRAMATTVFCPPESCDIVRNDVLWPVKETSIRTPLVWSMPMPGCSSKGGAVGGGCSGWG